ncbi:TetR/AcrR family transcriptional regulator [Smaragdicoccus niigatensis]|uniref:TetR/AcrR family transcriptional regulator n=1 Tax=Smaragdicoccus niigatensis TaxID=359359 RepID=UPI00038082FD|nr:TetR/AcrR family transcriptional regulator [Smaragdicoccus niigatensis]
MLEVSETNAVDTVEARILDAALVQFEKVGFRKTTIEDIARQAGVDRVTVYRRIGSRDDVVQAVVSREVAATLAELDELPAKHDNIDDLIADIFVTIIVKWRNHALVQRMLVLEPERLVTKLTIDGELTFTMSVAATASALRRAVSSGLVPEPTDLETRAELVCRVVHSMILAPYGQLRNADEQHLDAFARKFLVPIVTG